MHMFNFAIYMFGLIIQSIDDNVCILNFFFSIEEFNLLIFRINLCPPSLFGVKNVGELTSPGLSSYSTNTPLDTSLVF